MRDSGVTTQNDCCFYVILTESLSLMGLNNHQRSDRVVPFDEGDTENSFDLKELDQLLIDFV